MKNSILILIITFVTLSPVFAEAGSAKLISSTSINKIDGELTRATIFFEDMDVLVGTETYFPKRVTVFEFKPDFKKIEFNLNLKDFSYPKKEGKLFAGFIPKTVQINLGDKKGFLLYFIPEWK